MKTISIITLTFNSEVYIKNYLNSLKEYLPKESEVILVDNGSDDKTLDIVKEYSFIKVIANRNNLGFAKGCNLGAKLAEVEYLFFLNPDCKLINNSLNSLLEYIYKNPNVGIVAPKLMQSEVVIQPTVRKLPSVLGAVKEYYLGIKNSYEAFVPKGENPQKVESVVGAAILIRKEIFEKVGGFDEKFFMYYEDLDLCLRVRKLGFNIVYFPRATILHSVGGSISEKKKQYIESSAKIYHGMISYLILKIVLALRPSNINRILRGN